MKKNITGIVFAMSVLLLVGCAGQGEPGAAGNQTMAAQPQQTEEVLAGAEREAGAEAAEASVDAGGQENDRLTEEEAKKIALEQAGAAEADAEFVKIRLDEDDRREEYELEFYVGNVEYDVELDARTGEVISYDYETKDGRRPAADGQQSTQSGEEGYLSQEQVKEIVTAHAGIAEADVKGWSVDFDRNGRRPEYEVEFRVGRTEYDYEVDAKTGEIISYEMDAE